MRSRWGRARTRSVDVRTAPGRSASCAPRARSRGLRRRSCRGRTGSMTRTGRRPPATWSPGQSAGAPTWKTEMLPPNVAASAHRRPRGNWRSTPSSPPMWPNTPVVGFVVAVGDDVLRRAVSAPAARDADSESEEAAHGPQRPRSRAPPWSRAYQSRPAAPAGDRAAAPGSATRASSMRATASGHRRRSAASACILARLPLSTLKSRNWFGPAGRKPPISTNTVSTPLISNDRGAWVPGATSASCPTGSDSLGVTRRAIARRHRHRADQRRLLRAQQHLGLVGRAADRHDVDHHARPQHRARLGRPVGGHGAAGERRQRRPPAPPAPSARGQGGAGQRRAPSKRARLYANPAASGSEGGHALAPLGSAASARRRAPATPPSARSPATTPPPARRCTRREPAPGCRAAPAPG